MDRPSDGSERRSYYACFVDGPRDATQTVVLGLDSGQPPDLLLTPGRPGWVYVLAGGALGDGCLPYLWMPKSKVDDLRRRGDRRARDRDAHT